MMLQKFQLVSCLIHGLEKCLPSGKHTKQLLKMAIKMVDLPIKNDHFPQLCQFTRGYSFQIIIPIWLKKHAKTAATVGTPQHPHTSSTRNKIGKKHLTQVRACTMAALLADGGSHQHPPSRNGSHSCSSCDTAA